MMLTPSQTKALKEIKLHFDTSRIICVCGKKGAGTRKVIKNFISELDDVVIWDYNLILNNNVKDTISLSHNLREMLERVTSRYIYIESFEEIILCTSSYKFGNSQLSYTIWRKFLKDCRHKIILSCSKGTALDLINKDMWFVEIDITNEDRKSVLSRFITDEEKINKALSYVRGTNLVIINKAASQATRLKEVEGGDWITIFNRVLGMLDSRTLDVRNKVIKPVFDLDMVGLEDIVDEIKREIIEPIKIGDPYLPICKGVLLHGPPGSGKSTIGRWLSHELEGRVYLAESTPNESLFISFTKCLKSACENAPSIVFIDDCESLLTNQTLIGELCARLDGIDNTSRQYVCVVATIMDIGNVHEALIRGGRFEKCIQFDHPSSQVITSIIRNRFNKVIESGTPLGAKLGQLLNEEEYIEMAKLVCGWSPSNIHLVIDTIIRLTSYRMDRNEQDSISSLFYEEAKRIGTDRKRSIRGNYTKPVSETSYYS